jgi:hypothetical protein
VFNRHTVPALAVIYLCCSEYTEHNGIFRYAKIVAKYTESISKYYQLSNVTGDDLKVFYPSV